MAAAEEGVVAARVAPPGTPTIALAGPAALGVVGAPGRAPAAPGAPGAPAVADGDLGPGAAPAAEPGVLAPAGAPGAPAAALADDGDLAGGAPAAGGTSRVLGASLAGGAPAGLEGADVAGLGVEESVLAGGFEEESGLEPLLGRLVPLLLLVLEELVGLEEEEELDFLSLPAFFLSALLARTFLSLSEAIVTGA